MKNVNKYVNEQVFPLNFIISNIFVFASSLERASTKLKYKWIKERKKLDGK